jgi:hypothetical protein
LKKELKMLFCATIKARDPIAATVVVEALTTRTADIGKIRLGGATRLPVKTADTGKIRLGGACRLPLKTA